MEYKAGSDYKFEKEMLARPESGPKLGKPVMIPAGARVSLMNPPDPPSGKDWVRFCTDDAPDDARHYRMEKSKFSECTSIITMEPKIFTD